MFDTIIHRTGGGSTTSHVHEHRAPTDESIKLANEMREKIEKGVIDSFPLPFNGLQGEIWVVRDHMRNETKFNVLVNLNGAKLKIDWTPKFMAEPREAFRELRDLIATRIANEVFDAAEQAQPRSVNLALQAIIAAVKG
jgi:hypothetical protein